MNYLDRNVLNDKKELKIANKLYNDISLILKSKEVKNSNAVSIAAYMVWKACEYEYPYQAVPAIMEVDEDIKEEAMSFLTTDIWMKMLALINNYEAKYFGIVVLTSDDETTTGYDDSTPESIINLANAILDIK